MQRQPRVDDVLHDHDVATRDRGIEILEQAHAATGALGIAGELDQIDPVHDRQRPREIREEHGARLQRRHEDRLKPLVVGDQEPTQLLHTGGDLLMGEIDLPDLSVR